MRLTLRSHLPTRRSRNSLNSRASAFAYLYRTLRANEPEAAEYKVMSGLWALNRGVEIEHTAQWMFFLEDAKAHLGNK